MQLFNRKITKVGSFITSIILESDAYAKDSLTLNFGDSELIEISRLKDALAVMGGTATYMGDDYCIIPGNKAREVIGYLFLKHFIDNELRSDIEPSLLQLEKNLNYKKASNKYSVNVGQKDALASVVDPYLDGVFECSKDYGIFTKLLQCAMSRNFQYELKWLFEKEASLNTLSDEDDQSLTDCMESLNKIFFGLANMESSFTRLGSNPDLTTQRKQIYKIFIQYFNAQFSNIDIEERFICAAELYLMVCRSQNGVYLIKTRGMIEDALLNPEHAKTDRDISRATTFLGGIDTVLHSAAAQFSDGHENASAAVMIERSRRWLLDKNKADSSADCSTIKNNSK